MYSNAYENDYFMEARRLIENKEFKRAYNFLQSVNDKCSEWHYLTGSFLSKFRINRRETSVI